MKVRTAVVGLTLCLVFLAAVVARAEPLRFGILPVLDTLPLQVAGAEGLFEQAGLDVELVIFQSALERDTAMQAGQIQGYFGDLIATLLLIDKGADMRVATISYRTSLGQPMFGISTAPDVHSASLGDLAGSTIGISATTIIEYLLDRILDAEGLPRDHFQRVEVKKVPIRLQMLATGQLDLALLPEPLASLAVFQGGATVATAEHLDMPLTVLCLERSAFEGQGLEYAAFLDAYAKAVEMLNENPGKYRALMARTCRIPPPLVNRFPVYSYPAPALPTVEEVDAVQAWMLERGLLQAPVPFDRVVPRVAPAHMPASPGAP